MLRQKKLSEIKNDFINNMTHEFKTPLATISLAVDAMKNDKVIGDKEKLNYFSSIIKEENQRMNRQVETILKAALLDKQEVNLMLKPTHVHDVIKDIADNFILQLNDKNGKVEMDLEATNDLIEADEVHFPNLINNLIDNSVKYAKEDVQPETKAFYIVNIAGMCPVKFFKNSFYSFFGHAYAIVFKPDGHIFSISSSTDLDLGRHIFLCIFH